VVVPRLSDLISSDFYLWESDTGKFYETNAHTLGEIRNNIRSDISTISREESRKIRTTCYAGVPAAFGQEGNIFST
jgi:hypothetical protein